MVFCARFSESLQRWNIFCVAEAVLKLFMVVCARFSESLQRWNIFCVAEAGLFVTQLSKNGEESFLSCEGWPTRPSIWVRLLFPR